MATLQSRLSLEALKSAVHSYVDANKIDLSSLSVTKDNIVGLVDTIGKIYTLDSVVYDKLPELDGEKLSYGKVVEEWQQDMCLPVSYDEDTDGNKALKDYTPNYRDVSFSISLGRKIFPTSIPFGNVERAVHNQGQYEEVVAMITKKLEDSVSLWKYDCKRELIGAFIDKVEGAMSSSATSYVQNTTALTKGSFYKATYGSPSGTHYGVAMLTQDAENKTFAQLIETGKIIELQAVKEVAIPVDTDTGEAFIQAVKEAVEKAKDVSEGFSLSGNVIGVEEGLKLYVKQGVMPNLEVKTLSGAFHEEKLALGVETKVIKDFGKTSSTAFAVLVDPRGIRLFEGYNATRSNENGWADRLNLFRHVEYTGHVSRNAFICVFRPASA